MVFIIKSMHRYHSIQKSGLTCNFDVTLKKDDQYLTYKLSPCAYDNVVKGKHRIGDKVFIRDGDGGIAIEDECKKDDNAVVTDRYLVHSQTSDGVEAKDDGKMNYLPFLSDTPLFFETVPQRIETFYKDGAFHFNGKIKYEMIKNEQKNRKKTSFEQGKHTTNAISSPNRGGEVLFLPFVAKIVFKSRIIAYNHDSFPFYQVLVVIDLTENKLVTVVLWNRSVYKYCNLQCNDIVIIPRCRKKKRYYNNGVMVYNSYSDVWMFDCEEFSVNGRDEIYVCDIRKAESKSVNSSGNEKGIGVERLKMEDKNDVKEVTGISAGKVDCLRNDDNRAEEEKDVNGLDVEHSLEGSTKRIRIDDASALDSYARVRLSTYPFDAPSPSFSFLHSIEGRINYISILLRKRKVDGTFFLANDKIEEFYLLRIGEMIVYLFNTSEKVFYELDAYDYVTLENMRIVDTSVYVCTIFTTITKKNCNTANDHNHTKDAPSTFKKNLKAVQLGKKIDDVFISGAIGYHNLEVKAREEIQVDGCVLNVEIVPFINIIDVELAAIRGLCNSLVINEMKRIRTRGYYLGIDEGVTVGYYEVHSAHDTTSKDAQNIEIGENITNGNQQSKEQKGKYVLIGNIENISDVMIEMDVFDNLLVNEEAAYNWEKKRVYTISVMLLRVDENNVLKIISKIE